jgi:hypothetical protein
MLVMPKLTSPLLVRTTLCIELVSLSGWLAKDRLVAEKTAEAPVALPTSGTKFGDPFQSPATWNKAENEVLDVGTNVTSKVQLAPTAIGLLQWLTTLNGEDQPQEPMFMGLAVVLVRVTVWIGLTVLTGIVPKSRLAGDVNGGTLYPLSGATMFTVPLIIRKPSWPLVLGGVKVTLIVQEAPGSSVAPQVLVWAKGPNCAAMDAIESVSVPVFV